MEATLRGGHCCGEDSERPPRKLSSSPAPLVVTVPEPSLTGSRDQGCSWQGRTEPSPPLHRPRGGGGSVQGNWPRGLVPLLC